MEADAKIAQKIHLHDDYPFSRDKCGIQMVKGAFRDTGYSHVWRPTKIHLREKRRETSCLTQTHVSISAAVDQEWWSDSAVWVLQTHQLLFSMWCLQGRYRKVCSLCLPEYQQRKTSLETHVRYMAPVCKREPGLDHIHMLTVHREPQHERILFTGPNSMNKPRA